MKVNDFDCIVIGAGHAGIEAAHAAAKIGAKTALVTISKDTIGVMSCNPAIGGLAKGQIAREVDALGGLMGLAIDATGIQFRILNRSKGPAVQSPRAQADKYKYAKWMQEALEQTENITIIEDLATDIVVAGGKVSAVGCASGKVYKTHTAIVATGTFLRGLMHIGSEQFKGGRIGEPASDALSESLERIGLELRRLKTGTPARLDPTTIDYDKCQVQEGDVEPQPFSFLNDKIDRPSVPCWITHTNEKIHKLLTDNIERAPLYTGQIKSTGPRYCPSIEIKIMRFPDRKRHQVFLEPEDEKNTSIYCNGISTSVPKDVQDQMLRLMPGTENARILKYGYAIEYDYCPPVQLTSSLETKKIEGLFLAGQINGTSGYEEAAGQGIIAGINAARKLTRAEPIVLGRDQAYIGVMIDDLRTRGIDEPYRMFTSRAEYRLSLRSDNADRRLTQIGKMVGLVGHHRWDRYQNKVTSIEKLKTYLKKTACDGATMWQKLKRPGSELVATLSDNDYVKYENFDKSVVEAAAIDAKYEGYLDKQQRLVTYFRNLDNVKIPAELDYAKIEHLRAEAKEKLSTFQPETFGQAGRISGITPADITVIQIHLKKYHK
ncbi:MAG: tRNA uridine-5-carboxymethylaminomethyl(34) synthesis enzyme MnmG [Phycisphaerales bacterium]|jgi:tRNA uridine 5-carboxymethylaminomethyl modification enzyme